MHSKADLSRTESRIAVEEEGDAQLEAFTEAPSIFITQINTSSEKVYLLRFIQMCDKLKEEHTRGSV